MSGLLVREANVNDKEKILELLENVNERLDYLHEYYDFFQTCQNISSYVCVTKKQTIGYVACHRVDDGETIITRAARVRADYRGRGVYKHMLMEIEANEKEKGRVRRYAMIMFKSSKTFNLQKYVPIAKKEAHVFEFTRRQLVETYTSNMSGLDEILQKLEGIPAAYLREPYSTYLFPEGRVIIDSVPLRLIESNVKMELGKDTVYVSNIHIDTNEIGTKTDTSPVKGLITASSVYQRKDKDELAMVLDVFGSDLTNFDIHVAFHLNRLTAPNPEHINLKLFTSKACRNKLIDDIFAPFGIKRLDDGPRIDDCIKLEVCEREMS